MSSFVPPFVVLVKNISFSIVKMLLSLMDGSGSLSESQSGNETDFVPVSPFLKVFIHSKIISCSVFTLLSFWLRLACTASLVFITGKRLCVHKMDLLPGVFCSF